MAWRFYQDPDYKDWVLLSEGPNPIRKHYDTVQILIENTSGVRVAPKRINPPPDSNPEWYVGQGGQWRKEPVGKPDIMREGQHLIMGAVFGALITLAAFVGIQIDMTVGWFLLAASAVINVLATHLFLRYEETEGDDIRDWEYRDIGGWLIGWSLATVPAAFYLAIRLFF